MAEKSPARVCSVEGCGKPHSGRGFCKYHCEKDRLKTVDKEKRKAWYAAWRERNRERLREKCRARIALDPDANRNRVKEWQRKFPEKMELKRKTYYARNIEKQRERAAKYAAKTKDKRKAYGARYAALNREKLAATSAKRRAMKLNATPAWADQFLISEVFHLAKIRSKATGISWHVDHIVPLRSDFVCGLHCEANLQVIPGRSNQSKSNRYWPNMPAYHPMRAIALKELCA